MARKRMIHPSLATSLTVAQLKPPARYGWVLLLLHVDDDGRARDNVDVLKAALWPLDHGYGPRKVASDLDDYARLELICRYTALDGSRNLHVPTWLEYQTISHPTASKVPPCPAHELRMTPDEFRSASGELREAFHPSVVKGSRDQRSEVQARGSWGSVAAVTA